MLDDAGGLMPDPALSLVARTQQIHKVQGTCTKTVYKKAQLLDQNGRFCFEKRCSRAKLSHSSTVRPARNVHALT